MALGLLSLVVLPLPLHIVPGVLGATAPPTWHRGPDSLVEAFPATKAPPPASRRSSIAPTPLTGTRGTLTGAAAVDRGFPHALFGSLPYVLALVMLGLARTGKLVTSRALILGLAFLGLSTSPGNEIKPLATGLAAGIILDATVVRALLVPALMRPLGDANWWMPRWTRIVLRTPHPKPAPESIS